MSLDFSFINSILGQRRKPVHELKWKLPEERITAPLEDAEKLIRVLKKEKGVKFKSGGEFNEVIYSKSFGEETFAYFIVRTDPKTENETLLFDGYMLQEEDKLGLDIASSYSFRENLESMGYKETLSRSITLWVFSYLSLRLSVQSVEGVGDFLEVALPATKIEKVMETQQKQAGFLLKKLGFKLEDSIPTDVITLQILSMRQDEKKK